MSTISSKRNEGIGAVVESPEWESKVDLIRRTVAAGATDDELELFFHQARRAGLDPLARQIHFVKRRGRGVVQVGIDGLRLIADRTSAYAGSDDARFESSTQEGRPSKATVTVYKMVQGQRCPFSATARWEEYYPGDELGFQWRKMPHAMLAKCAEALALRKAFPADMSGLYIHEEMQQADTALEAPIGPTPSGVVPLVPLAAIESEEELEISGEELHQAALTLLSASKPEPVAGPAPRRSAFGYLPTQWPRERMLQEPATEQQERMIASRARLRRVPARDLDRLQSAVTSAFGLDRSRSKAAASLFIDWLMNADERALDRALEVAATLPDSRLSA